MLFSRAGNREVLGNSLELQQENVAGLALSYLVEQPAKSSPETARINYVPIVPRERLKAIGLRTSTLTRHPGDQALAVATRTHAPLPLERYVDPLFGLGGNNRTDHPLDPGLG